MPVTRANVEATKAFIRDRLGNPYVYGGALTTNVKQGTDCSEVWQTVLEMVHGRWRQGRQSEGATTESYRYIPVGGIGPFGTIRANHWRDIPANAAARIAFHHGPGGGANSHMWGELDGMRIESGGGKGLVTGTRAMAVEDGYATAWAYLPGPIVADGTPIPPTPVYLGQEYENYGDRVRQLQEALNRNGASVDVDGEFGPLTEAAVRAFQQSKGLDPDGVAGPVTLTLLGLTFGAPQFPAGEAADVLARATGLAIARATQILIGVVNGLRDSQCTNVNRIAMWVAQMGHESAGFNATEEYASGADYEGRCESLGNCFPGDGVRFKGRTWIQITGRSNYTQLSKWAHSKGIVPTPTFFVDDSRKLAEMQYAGLGPAWYWTVARADINALSDRRDLVTVTRRINGGTNGLPDRQNRYNRALALGDQLLQLTRPALPPSQGDDELSAEAERKITELYNAFLVPTDSLSPLRKPGEGKVAPLVRFLRYMDGNTHVPFMRLMAELGSPNVLRDLEEVATMDLSRYPDRTQEQKELAQAILADVTNPAQPQVVVASAAAPSAAPVADNREVVAAVEAAVESAVARSQQAQPQPQIVYAPLPPELAAPPAAGGTTGQRVGQLIDTLESLNIDGDLPPEVKASLEAVAGILKTMVGSKS